MNRPVVVVPLLVVGGLVLVAIPAVIFLTGGGFNVPASLGGGGNGSPAWHGVVVVVGLPTVTAVGFKKTLDWLDRAPPSRR